MTMNMRDHQLFHILDKYIDREDRRIKLLKQRLAMAKADRKLLLKIKYHAEKAWPVDDEITSVPVTPWQDKVHWLGKIP